MRPQNGKVVSSELKFSCWENRMRRSDCQSCPSPWKPFFYPIQHQASEHLVFCCLLKTAQLTQTSWKIPHSKYSNEYLFLPTNWLTTMTVLVFDQNKNKYLCNYIQCPCTITYKVHNSCTFKGNESYSTFLHINFTCRNLSSKNEKIDIKSLLRSLLRGFTDGLEGWQVTSGAERQTWYNLTHTQNLKTVAS